MVTAKHHIIAIAWAVTEWEREGLWKHHMPLPVLRVKCGLHWKLIPVSM